MSKDTPESLAAEIETLVAHPSDGFWGDDLRRIATRLRALGVGGERPAEGDSEMRAKAAAMDKLEALKRERGHVLLSGYKLPHEPDSQPFGVYFIPRDEDGNDDTSVCLGRGSTLAVAIAAAAEAKG